MATKSLCSVFYDLFLRNNPNPRTSIGSYSLNQCVNGDCTELSQIIPNNTVDAIITDPPFAIEHGKNTTTNYNRKSNIVLQGYNEINKENYYEFSNRWLKEAHRILKKDGNMCLISGWSNQRDILNALHDVGFHIKSQIIFKYNFGVFTTKNFVSSHYNIFFCSKHKTKYTFNKLLWYPEDVFESDNSFQDVWEIQREYWKGKIKTPNKLPKELVEMLISFTTVRKDLILDFFSGAGTILKVANYMDRNCLSFEIVKDYADFGNYRLHNLPY